MNTTLLTHEKRLQSLQAVYGTFNTSVGQVSNSFNGMATATRTVNANLAQTVQGFRNVGNAANNAGGAGVNFLTTMLRFRGISLVFEGITKAVAATIDGIKEMEKQAARVARVNGTGSTPFIRAGFAEEAARTGASIQEIGEAAYQIAPFVKNLDDQFAALKTTMNLVVGSESDARETARALIQIYNEFGTQLDQNASKTENLTRIGNMFAIMFKETNTEVSELTESMKFLGPTAASAHISLEKVLALVGALDKAGLRSSTAGTGSSAFISQLITRYRPQLPGKDYGGVQYKGQDFAFEAPRDPKTGGIDPIKTLQSIRDHMEELRRSGANGAAQADLYWKAVSGSERAARASGAIVSINKALEDAITLMQKLEAEHRRTGTAAEDLRKTMDTTAQEFQKVWGGAITYISNLIDTSGLRDVFHGWAGDLQRAAEQYHLMRGMLDAQNNWAQNALTGGNGTRQSVEVTQATVRQALANLRASHNAPPITQLTAGSELDIATRDMTPAQRNMIRARYLPGGDTMRRLDEGAMANDLATMLRQLDNPQFGRAPYEALGPANPYGPGLRTKHAPSISDTQKTIDKAADEALKKHIQEVQDKINVAIADYKIKLEQFGASDVKTIGAAQFVDVLKTSLANLQHDQATINLNKAGVETQVAQNKDAIDKAHEKASEEAKKALKQHAEATAAYADLAETKYGLYSDITTRRAQEANKAAKEAADADEDTLTSWKIIAGVEGPLKKLIDKRREQFAQGGESAQTISFGGFPLNASIIDILNNRPQEVKAKKDTENEKARIRALAEESNQRANQSLQDLQANTDAKIRGFQRTARSGGIFGDPLAAEQTANQKTVAQYQAAGSEALSKLLAAMTDLRPTSEAAAAFVRLAEALKDAKLEGVELANRLKQNAHDEAIKRDDDAYSLQTEQIAHQHRIKFNKDEADAYKDKIVEYQQLIGAAEAHLNKIVADNAGITGPKTDDERRKAEKQLTEAQQNLSDYKIDQVLQKYQNVKSSINGALLDFFHGKGDITDVIKTAGGSIVDAALENQIKKFSDPLIQTVTGQILAIQGNTEALGILNSTLSGGGSGVGGIGGASGSFSGGGAAVTGFGAVVAAGVAAGISSSLGDSVLNVGVGGPLGAPRGAHKGAAGQGGQSDLQKGIGAGLAAYSIGATSAAQGVNAGNFLGGILSGAGIGASFGPAGALIGGAVGGIADLIGGLFHHKSTPTQTPQDLNPALYNAPAGMDLAAYNYSAYGKLPTLQDVGFQVKAANTPVIQVFVDGAAVAAKKVVNAMGSSVAVNLINSSMDRFAPI